MTPCLTIADAFSPQDCADLVALAAGAALRDAALVGKATNHGIRRADLVWVDDLPDSDWVMARLIGVVAEANRAGYTFDLSEFAESAQIARYGAERQGHFDWHSDIGAGALASRRKLTVVVQLSDPATYRGGGLELRPDSAIIDASPDLGTATVFPSFVLHRVTPVTEGVRWSLTLWAHGPAFR
ncbi:2OG-Fe(II) oxygenase [Paracoccaceae bacterium Fryx2]|nr:2OG-Fe(II) oxygenase [Paracoccaceae bacterium Fryx2]